MQRILGQNYFSIVKATLCFFYFLVGGLFLDDYAEVKVKEFRIDCS